MKRPFPASTFLMLRRKGLTLGCAILAGGLSVVGFTSISQSRPSPIHTTSQLAPPPPPLVVPNLPPPPPVVVPGLPSPPPVVVPTFPTATPWQDIKLLHTLRDAHWGPVYTLTFSPDGKFFASGGSEIDNRIRFWNPRTGKRTRSFKGHNTRVLALAITPDNRTLASGSDDNTIKLWNLREKQLSRGFIETFSNILSLAITADGQTLVSGGLTGIRVWDLRTQRFLYSLVPLSQPIVRSIALSPNRPLLVSGSEFGEMQLWNLANSQSIGVIGRHAAAVTSVKFTPDGDNVVSSSLDHTLRIWNLRTGGVSTLVGHTNAVNAVAVNPDGQTLASAGRDGVRLWDLRTGQQIGAIPGYSDWVQSLAFSPDGQLLVTGGFDGSIRIWEGVY